MRRGAADSFNSKKAKQEWGPALTLSESDRLLTDCAVSD